jgi:hypothetical protein
MVVVQPAAPIKVNVGSGLFGGIGNIGLSNISTLGNNIGNKLKWRVRE